MNKWQYTIDVSDLWAKAKDEEITAAQLGHQLSAGLRERKIPVPVSVWSDFDTLETGATFDDFDEPLERLYDWADKRKRLWIKTF